MPTLTATITEELLDAVDDSARLETVLQRHKGSKGPLYLGLAEATTQLRARLEVTGQAVVAAETQRAKLQDQADALEQCAKALEQRVHDLEAQATRSEQRLAGQRELLDRASELTRQGFGKADLDRLHGLLAAIAAAQGAAPEQGVSAFFVAVERYEQVTSLELERQRAEARAAKAKAEAERADAEARAAEARSKTRRASIEITEGLLAQGVKAVDLPLWTKVVARAGVTVESMASALDRYTSLEALVHARERRAAELHSAVSRLQRQVKALTTEREGVGAAIQALRDEALRVVRQAGRDVAREVTAAGERAKEQMDALASAVDAYEHLTDEAAALRSYLDVAKLLHSDGPAVWRALPRELIQRLLLGAIRWVGGEGRDVAVEPPQGIASLALRSAWKRPRLSEVLLWALAGTFTEAERKALGTGQRVGLT